jgi:hypothetical protein
LVVTGRSTGLGTYSPVPENLGYTRLLQLQDLARAQIVNDSARVRMAYTNALEYLAAQDLTFRACDPEAYISPKMSIYRYQ